MVLYGANGSGKSSFAKSISRWQKSIKHLLRPIPHPTSGEFTTPERCFVNWAKVVDGFKNQDGNGFAVIEDLRACSLLILDDLGSEYDKSSVGMEKVYTLLTDREFMWNIITTNYPPDQWSSKFESRVDSRLWRNAEHIDMRLVPDYSKI